ncbi:hypothetical protein BCR39DRAFT_512779 [Naematelia encephala]|uniref:Cytidylyltransferase family-domain-containing protein n=1 Tax=Naematelia encephala TaxID=71784 RepID=A0A1Y2BM89_9TREE|nr:hypothetical protein BCR39DRAFT_512779 [Naematelia encephala]
MAQAISLSPSPGPLSRLGDGPSRLSPSSPRTSRSSLSASVSPPPSTGRPSSSSRLRKRDNQENEPVASTKMSDVGSGKLNGAPRSVGPERDMGNGGGRTWRDGSVDHEEEGGVKIRKNVPRSTRASKSPGPTSAYNGLPTLPTIPADSETPVEPTRLPPPPAPSANAAFTGVRPPTRKRRSSSIKRKPSPGVTPTKAVDWEIPRKTLHSSIGFLTLGLNHLDPPSLKPLITVLSTLLVSVLTSDVLRLNFPAFAEIWETYLGFLMRESERNKVNGVVWYLVGVIFVLGLYPRDVAVVSILTLSWSDTTASTIGRLWGKYTPPLPVHVPGIKALPFAPRKSLAGFLAATVTGVLICVGFWWNGSNGRWAILDSGPVGLGLTAVVVGLGGAVVEALDLGLDDNLTLPILSGAIIWLWLASTSYLIS